MNFDYLSKEYVNLITANPALFHKDYLNTIEAVKDSDAKFHDEPVPFLYHPLFFATEDIDGFKGLTATLSGILNKVINRYLNSAEFRRKFGFSELLEELILVDPGYDVNVPMARYDIFYHQSGLFKFCELNADGSSGMNKTNVLERIFLNSAAVNQMKAKYQISYFELIDSWVEASLKNYHQYNSEQSKPNVVIMDWQDAGNIKEFEAFKEAYQKRGCKAEIVDPRHLKYDGDKLYYNDTRVDLIYRRLVTSELIERQRELTDFIEAYRNGAVCVVGSLRSEIIHNKIIFKILHQDAMGFLSKDERDFINNHVPFTAEFGGNKELCTRIQRGKNNYVLKPRDQYAAAGVYLGKDFDEVEWQQIISQCWENDYLVQEYCQPYVGELIEFKDGQPIACSYNQMLGLFVYNEAFAGLYTRVGRNNVISHAHGYYLLPNFFVEEL